MLRDKIAEKYAISREWSCYDEVIMERCLRFSDAILNLPEIKEMQEKAAICDALSRDYDFDLREIQKWKENSDKWDAMNGTETKAAWDSAIYNQKRAERVEKILEGLEVEEKFNEYEGFHNGEGFARTRPATPKEFREFVLAIFNEIDLYGHLGDWERVTETGFTLNSGAVLKLKEGAC